MEAAGSERGEEKDASSIGSFGMIKEMTHQEVSELDMAEIHEINQIFKNEPTPLPKERKRSSLISVDEELLL